ncbi:hypothetical protein GGP41_002332 [Bipolaris sorokiniana]|uniref:AA1-like domain-containing protein n=2 Tax=Cochliobolus sativus TaxID=45130 RepID=A0A8H6DXF4_COCSA|nr:uncharacterized protein COCSADRAFT_38992 [Bipolaris sorokiniana ND90Pr]EMD62216.1 hypothetical protein COCSADRAFT_38992 [Bipolaris sorokiniana ND90Pr]KAF5850080.1 hypothetical protein GGP41_002332 [Bipolaris sorokiniana]
MQFSAVLLALAASASAAVLPRQEMGQWAVTASVGPAPGYVYLHAEFTSDEYPGDKKLRSTCVEAPNAELPVAHRCDRAAFDFQWDGKVLNVQQTLPSGATLFGSAPYDGSSDFDGVIPVEKAII